MPGDRGGQVGRRIDLLQGTLDLLILRTLRQESRHGWGISKHIRETSRGTLEVNQGSLYPALHRLEDRGWIAGEWGISEEGRRAKFYRLTRLGRSQLETESESWRRFATAVEWVLAGET
jgi:transcriptional regulator